MHIHMICSMYVYIYIYCNHNHTSYTQYVHHSKRAESKTTLHYCYGWPWLPEDVKRQDAMSKIRLLTLATMARGQRGDPSKEDRSTGRTQRPRGGAIPVIIHGKYMGNIWEIYRKSMGNICIKIYTGHTWHIHRKYWEIYRDFPSWWIHIWIIIIIPWRSSIYHQQKP